MKKFLLAIGVILIVFSLVVFGLNASGVLRGTPLDYLVKDNVELLKGKVDPVFVWITEKKAEREVKKQQEKIEKERQVLQKAALKVLQGYFNALEQKEHEKSKEFLTPWAQSVMQTEKLEPFLGQEIFIGTVYPNENGINLMLSFGIKGGEYGGYAYMNKVNDKWKIDSINIE